MAKWDLSKLPEGRKPLPDEWFAERAQMQGRVKELEKQLRWVLYERDATFKSMLNRAETAADRIEELEAKLSKSVSLLDWAVDMTGEPHCYHDHHGYCQAHNLQPEGECWVELARPLIAELKGQDDE